MLASRSAPLSAVHKYPAAHFDLVDVVATRVTSSFLALVWDDAPVDDFCLLLGGSPEPSPHHSVIDDGMAFGRLGKKSESMINEYAISCIDDE